MTDRDPREPLVTGVSQYEVDFVIPRVGVDLPLGIDPFLLFKSRDSDYKRLHGQIVTAFNAGIEAVRRNRLDQARALFAFPEVSAIGFGYTQKGKRGSGVGSQTTTLILETLSNSPELISRGVRHVEEMQLLSAGIGPDRVSDIAANLLKRFLIEYTQKQCAIWRIPLTAAAPIHHVYDAVTQSWHDAYEDLPTNSVDGSPILLVPRRWVRVLPWINYDDFLRTEFRAYLSARREQVWSAPESKQSVVGVTRRDIGLVERYVRLREQQGRDAKPTLDYIDEDACKEAERLKQKLASVPTGRDAATDYQLTILEIINYLFNPDLIDGQPEVGTVDRTERRDIIFTNDSDETFWEYVRSTHDAILLMFEVKNKAEIDLDDVNQTATYLGDRLGRLGVIIAREAPGENIQRKLFSVWNDSGPNRKVILTLSDHQLNELMDLRCRGGSPTKWMQAHYRKFRTSVQ